MHQLLLLKKGGKMIYAGPLGRNSQKIIDYFEVRHAPEMFLVHIMRILSKSNLLYKHRQFLEFQKLMINVIQPRGCSMLAQLQQNTDLVLILESTTKQQHCTRK